eukprot:TRINITY_DN15014_c0_g1_i1.p3 TRINITY_DN15014_c0_g1~~TRINITY_DN15014_c0_g1_i1.p3  ORF type:complete len:131 (+),score=19.08 TRINITY_DN15014_c0_g1_i1:50-442(+)
MDQSQASDFGRTWREIQKAEAEGYVTQSPRPTADGKRLSDTISKYLVRGLSKIDLNREPFSSTRGSWKCDDVELPQTESPLDCSPRRAAKEQAGERTPLRVSQAPSVAGRSAAGRDSEPAPPARCCCLVM